MTRADAPSQGGGSRHRDHAYAAASWIAIALAVAWRLPDLGMRSLWFDESFSWQLVQFPWREMIVRAQADVHPPLYYIILKPWIAVFGDSLLAMRLLSVAWFVIALVASYLLCGEAAATRPGTHRPDGRTAPDHGRDAGLIAMLLLGLSPFLFRYSQEVRMYTQLVALGLLSNWLLLRSLRAEARPALWWGAYALASAGVAYTHYFGLFTVAAQGVFCVGLLAAEAGPRGLLPWVNPTARRAIGAGLLASALYLPWLPTLWRQQEQVARDYWAMSIDAESPFSLAGWRDVALACAFHNNADMARPCVVPDEVRPALGILVPIAVALLVVLLAIKGGKVGWSLVAGVAVPVNLAILSCLQSNRNLIHHRYFLVSYVMLLIGLALVLAGLRPRWVRRLVVAGCCLALGLLTLQYQRSLGLPQNADLRGAADYIAGHRRAGDVMLCLSPLDFFSAKYHARGRFAVHLVRSPGTVARHYTGGPILRESDFIDLEPLLKRTGIRVWTAASGGDVLLSHAKDWERLERVTFAEALRYRGKLSVDLWGPTPAVRACTVPGAEPSPAGGRGAARGERPAGKRADDVSRP